MNEINDKSISNLIIFEPTRSILFTYEKYILELSYSINDIKDELTFLLFDKINKRMYESAIIKPTFIYKDLILFEKFDTFFRNVFTHPKAFKFEYFKENEISIKFYEYNSFDFALKSYTIFLFLTENIEDNIKRENDIEIESELRELVNNLDEETPKDKSYESLEKLTNEIKDLKTANIELSKRLIVLQKENEINVKYSHVQGIIKYCKGAKHGCISNLVLYGSNPYLLDKNIHPSIYCIAALHNGSINENGGFYIIKLSGQNKNFEGSVNNNINSNKYSNLSNSFTVHSVDKNTFKGNFDVCGNINI